MTTTEKELDKDKTHSPKRVRPLWKNPITLVGAVLAPLSAVFIGSLMFFSALSPVSNPYIGIWTYMVFPIFLVSGLFMMPGGIIVTRWYRLRHHIEIDERLRYPRLDLSLESHRRTVFWIGLATVFIVPTVGVITFKSYHFSSSSKFCGLSCHPVMDPQFSRFRHSPHAQIDCTKCHVGPGVKHAISAKINGIKQLFEVMTNSYPRPVPSALLGLRPAKETCQGCHWPSKYFGDRFFHKYSYKSDEKNTRREIGMFLKVGGGDPDTGPANGIHWHMKLGFKVEYVAEDRGLQRIPWTRFTNLQTKEQTVYRSDGVVGEKRPSGGIFRELDCMDCHNHAAHKIDAPGDLMDVALEVGAIDRSLPFIKREGLRALTSDYESKDSAVLKIDEAIRSFYKREYPKLPEERKASLDKAIERVQRIYRESFFPAMNTNWRTYPDNLGHKIFPGCFRCHDDKHVSKGGKKLATDCETCHYFLVPKSNGGGYEEGHFRHSLPLKGGLHEKVACFKCHDGGAEPVKTCAGSCHEKQREFIAGETSELSSYEIESSSMYEMVECSDCHDDEKPLSAKFVSKKCAECHEDEDYGRMLSEWMAELSAAAKRARLALRKLDSEIKSDHKSDERGAVGEKWIAEARRSLRSLYRAGPAHNYEASLSIYGAIAEKAEKWRAESQLDGRSAKSR